MPQDQRPFVDPLRPLADAQNRVFSVDSRTRMKKIDLGQMIQILANIGVIGGMLFLAYEIRQNTATLQLPTAA